MDRQATFDKVYRHLSRPGATRCVNPDDPLAYACAYVRPDGNRCAIGALLSDQTLAVMGHEAGSVNTIIGRFGSVRTDLGDPDDDECMFLRFLQSAHDSPAGLGRHGKYSHAEWQRLALARLVDIATRYGLRLPEGASA